ncbi:MAG: hypothetical protein ACRD96_09215 [Bryobacteraceae bacterium]
MILVTSVMCASAQLLPPVQVFPAELRQFLELSEAQVGSISALNAEFGRFTILKQLRIAQVQAEIAEETRKESPDAAALGVRYLELEAIRRHLVDEQARVREGVRAVLNDAQRVKLRVLEDARNLAPRIAEAECVNLLNPSLELLGVVARLPVPPLGCRGSITLPPVFTP